jgi:hypothetical protein
MALREAVWMGKSVEKRQGCQAAMRCSMCPAAAIVDKIVYSAGDVSDDYGSIEPKQGKLHADILQRVYAPMPIESWITRYNLTDRERELLFSAKPRVAAQMKTAPGANGKSTPFVEPRRAANTEIRPRKPVENTPTVSNEISHAARTGDMAAALNAA